MSSKVLLRIVFGFSLVVVAGCSLKLNDVPKFSNKAKIKNIGCLSGLEKKVAAYLDGRLSAQDVSATMACVRDALQEFNYIGRGERNDGFRPEELARFLNTKFLGESKITSEFLKELMNAKLLIVGGKADFVLNAEFDRLVELTHFIEKEAIRNIPYILIYKFDSGDPSKKDIHPAIIKEAKAQLVRTAYNVADILRSSRASYRMESIANLLSEARQFLRWDDNRPNPQSVDDWMEMLRVYKILAVGEEGSAVRPEEWVKLLGLFAECFGLVMEGHYQVKLDDVRKGNALEDFIRFVDQGLNLLLTSVNNQQHSVIEFSVIDRAIDIVDKMKFLPKGLRADESLKPLTRHFLTYMFRDPLTPYNKARSQGLTAININEFRKEFYLWAEGQRHLSRLYARVPVRSESVDLRMIWRSAGPTSGADAGHEIQFLMENIRPFYRLGDERVWVVPQDSIYDKQLRHHFEGLSRLNIMRTLGRLLIRGWARNTARVAQMKGITIEEANDFYMTVKKLGQDLKLVDPRKDNVGFRFFREANLFTFSGDGINPPSNGSSQHLMTLTESIEQLALIYSGMNIRNKVFDYAKKVCEQHNYKIERDIFGDPKIPAKCVKDFMVEQGYKHFSNLPKLKQYADRLTRADRVTFFNQLWAVSQSECSNLNWIEYGELVTFTTLMHYVEVIFNKYDLDQNDLLDGQEVMRSFSLFSGFLDEVLKVVHPDKNFDVAMQKSIFAYLVSKQTTPNNLLDFAKLKWWDLYYFNNDRHQFDEVPVEDIHAPNMAIDRTELMKVLGELNTKAKSEITCDPQF